MKTLWVFLTGQQCPNLQKDHFGSRNLVFLLLKKPEIVFRSTAGVAKLVDAPDLGSGAARRGGSSPSTRTIKQK